MDLALLREESCVDTLGIAAVQCLAHPFVVVEV